LAGPGPARKDAVFVSNRREDYFLGLLVLRLTGGTAVYVGRVETTLPEPRPDLVTVRILSFDAEER